MKNYKVAQKDDGTQVEEVRGDEAPSEFPVKDLREDCFVHLPHFWAYSEEQVDCVRVCHVVGQTHKKDEYNKLEKQLIIPLADTIIKPGTMVIKARNTPVASTAMLGIGKHKSGTHFTHVLVILICKTQTEKQNKVNKKKDLAKRKFLIGI